MRSFSLTAIIFLCLAILLVDIMAFYGLQSISQYIVYPFVQKGIYIAFWLFTVGLISAILLLKIRFQHVNPRLKQIYISSLYGLTISSFLPKILFVIIIAILYFSKHLFSPEASLIIVPVVGLFSGFLPFFIIASGIFRTLYRFKIRNEKIKIKGLSQSLSKLRIV